ncbi:hypothetical protein LTR85_012052 [Meristemomyces frigidus]|nr:hypothetical protein LTR85_012052 [Meristemomyces frigidus]
MRRALNAILHPRAISATPTTDRPRTTDNAAPFILRLPNELLDRIADSVIDIPDLLRLRLAGNGRLARSALDSTQRRMTTIYVEHSKKSLARFREVCNSASHARWIKEVKFVASVRELPPKALMGHDAFREVVESEKIPRDVVSRVLTIYLQEKNEQATVMRRGELCETLCDYAQRLPNLSTLSICALPDSPLRSGEGQWEWPSNRPERAYNRLRRWHTATHPQEDHEPFLCREIAQDQLLYMAQYSVPGLCDNLELIARSLARLAEQSTTPRIKLAMSGPLTMLDAQWEVFANQQQHMLTPALGIVTEIDIRAEPRWKNRKWPPGQWNTDLTILPRWERLLLGATHIKKLRIDGVSEEASEVLKHVIERTRFPELEDLALEVWVTLWKVEDFYSGTVSHSAEALGRFLHRHQQTLKHLVLRHASGTDFPDYKPSATSFAILLDVMRNSLPKLQSAEVIEALYVFDQADAGPTWSEGTPFGHLPPAERDRAREQDSDIGQLARRCGITPSEHFIGRGYEADAEMTEHGGGLHGYGELNRVFWYEYHFGPYVLGGRT